MLRYDITTNDWVIFAPNRARRPHELAATTPPPPGPSGSCPFCPGNESRTPGEIYAVRDGSARDAPGWRVRVVPNQFPALRIEEDIRRVEEGPLQRTMPACGAHEVIIESPEHDRVMAEQPVEHLETLLRTLQLRHTDLMNDRRFQTIMIFKNHGVGAGTSLRHPHWQLIATPVVPHMLRIKYEIATQYFDQFGRCLYCDLREQEMAAGARVVARNDAFSALMPYAARLPFETWIMPGTHLTSFGRTDPALMRPLAEILRSVLRMLYLGLHDPAFNIVINSAARGEEDEEAFLWHMEILPRLSLPAGFELGSGMWINSVLPEEAASFLRGVEI
jgi:UDPglucose--hexose-1-phosphate uridylyltransferase